MLIKKQKPFCYYCNKPAIIGLKLKIFLIGTCPDCTEKHYPKEYEATKARVRNALNECWGTDPQRQKGREP